MKNVKIVALLLVLFMMVCAVASCGKTPESAIEKADKALTQAPYKVEMDMEFTCNDAIYGSIFEGMSTDMDMYIDGDKFIIELGMMGITMNITYVDDTAYYLMSAYGETVKQKVTLTEEQRNELLENNGASVGVDALDFENVTMSENDDGETVITCDTINAEALDDLINSTFGEEYQSAGMQITAKDVSMSVVIDDGKYETMTVSLTYVLEIEGESIEVGAVIELEYDYDAKTITAPSDAGSYTQGNYGDIFGE